jgi:hypothetical protein
MEDNNNEPDNEKIWRSIMQQKLKARAKKLGF